MCFAQISFPIDVVPLTKIRPLVFVQIHVLQFLFYVKTSKIWELLEREKMPSPIESWQLSWDHSVLTAYPKPHPQDSRATLQRCTADLGFQKFQESPGYQQRVQEQTCPICLFMLLFEECSKPGTLCPRSRKCFYQENVSQIQQKNSLMGSCGHQSCAWLLRSFVASLVVCWHSSVSKLFSAPKN